MRHLVNLVVAGLLIVIWHENAQGQNSPELLMKVAANRLLEMHEQFRPADAGWFSPEFYKSVTPEQLQNALQENRKALGPLERIRLCRILDPRSAELEYISQDGKRLRASIRLEAEAPFRCCHLQFGVMDRGDDTWAKLSIDLQKLPGHHGAAVWKLKPDKTKVFEHHATDAMAVGSSFKLLILNVLSDEINSGKRKWTDIIQLREEGRSLPSGMLQDWPIGSPITLHTLATIMVVRSDNTAADHLMLTLGREALEQAQTAAQVMYPERNRPFLRTAELFKLKLVAPSNTLTSYMRHNEGEKRLMLEKLERTPLREPRIYTMPTGIDQVEWFFTANDLCKVMERLMQSPQQASVLPLLQITKPFDIDDHAWEYLGFKGGAEVGVLNLTLLGKLRNKPDWYALSFTWNRTDEPLDEPAWIRLVQRAMLIIERGK